SVTLYRLFCEATGYGGTTQRVVADTAVPSARMVTVSFDAQVADGLPWAFKPLQQHVTLRLGEEKLVFFYAKNLSNKPIVAHATFNVTPTKAGPYFNKVQCFCFSDERPARKRRCPSTFTSIRRWPKTAMPPTSPTSPCPTHFSPRPSRATSRNCRGSIPARRPTPTAAKRCSPSAAPPVTRRAATWRGRCSAACSAARPEPHGTILIRRH